ncbi:hypothetical protein [uncultured Microscilla sp.]|uniref:hypothetical protein n=1 Tax=uncultured Microscilla sp. TaxID=432653 RepID=UPI002622323E|nr:hypothetical protein [uncultured Microscilla sp.]
MNNLASEFIWEINTSKTPKKRKKSTGHSTAASLKQEMTQLKIELKNRMTCLEEELGTLKAENAELRNEIKVYATIMSEIQNSSPWT